MSTVTDILTQAGVTPVIRTSTEEAARRAVTVLYEEGFRVFEITLTTPGASDIIRDLSNDPDLLVGVGTVLTVDQGQEAIDTGASFVVSPAHVTHLGAICTDAGVPLALGAATPSEVLRAHDEGASFVKIFPAQQLGGAGFIKALRSVFPHIALMPTGGINPADIDTYLDAGAVCLGMGGNLVNEAALTSGNDALVRDAARAVRAILAARP